MLNPSLTTSNSSVDAFQKEQKSKGEEGGHRKTYITDKNLTGP